VPSLMAGPCSGRGTTRFRLAKGPVVTHNSFTMGCQDRLQSTLPARFIDFDLGRGYHASLGRM
jgi:hypothetical protein